MSPSRENAPVPEFYEIHGWRRIVIWPFVLLVRLWCRSLRMDLDAAGKTALRELPPGAMFILWHNRLFAGAEFHRRYRSRYARVAGLISASRDGAWLSAFFGAFGMMAVRGSSGRRGTEGAREMLSILKAGIDAGITVDGSKGPVYEAKEGAMMLARRTAAPLILLTPIYASAWRMKSWDRFFIPRPFSRVRFELETYANVEAFAPGLDRKAATVQLTQRLRDLAKGTDPELGL
jgi:lysophospholipid acyltransferase (LPLAT)-like uncharacterized protein